MISTILFPRLTADNHRVTSPAAISYNCIAWALSDTKNWWQPGLHWPFPSHALDDTIEELKRVFETFGYQECPNGDLEQGFEKVVLYALSGGYTHAARQLSQGAWTSKLGNDDDIEHDTPDAVAGGIYGEIALFMKRPWAQKEGDG
jgi:hypothetical protein